MRDDDPLAPHASTPRAQVSVVVLVSIIDGTMRRARRDL